MLGRAIGGISLLLLSWTASAIDRVQLSWGLVEADGWRLSDVRLDLDWSDPDRSALTVKVALIQNGDQRMENLQLTCAAFDLLAAEIECREGKLSLTSDWLSAEGVPAAVSYQFASRELKASVSGLPLAGGKARLVLHHQGGEWRLVTTLADSMIEGVAGLVAKAGVEIPQLAYQGRISGELKLRGGAQGLEELAWNTRTRESGYANAEGSQAAEALQLFSTGSASPRGGDWRVRATLALTEGMLYAEPLYFEFSEGRPLELSADLHWRAGRGELLLDSLEFRQPEVVRGSLDAVLLPGAEKPLQKLGVEIEQGWLPGLYGTWIEPWLAGTVLEKLETEGHLRGRFSLVDGQPQTLQLTLNKISFREQSGQFGVEGLDGDLYWDSSGAAHESGLAWRGANFHQLRLGAAGTRLETDRSNMKMLQPLVVPLLDGELHVDQFELGTDDAGGVRWLLDAMLTPVSMQRFSEALGWPSLSGKLSGMVPEVRYEQGELTLGGILLVQAFDGDITVRNLRIQQPLGLVPRLWADARLEHLDLKTLTRTFSFGRIEGRLQGEVDGLYMEAWQLVAFDAHFETPPDDDSRHRISQRAVDNISNLGGAGVGGAVSRSFLRFLEDFPYKRLGIRCRLEKGVCHMGGVAPAEQGYYLVQGRQLPPRLDVVGYSEEVDWQSLVDRLMSITEGEPPRVD